MKTTRAGAPSEPFHYRHRNFFVGLFVLIPLLIIPLFAVFSLVRSERMQKWRILYVRFDTGEGLQKGSPVTIRGIRVGHVDAVVLNERGLVDVRFKVKQRYGSLVKQNGIARLKQKNFVVGDWEIELTGGGEFALTAEDGDTLQGEMPVKLEQTVQQVTNLVASFDSMLQSVIAGEGLLGQLLQEDTLGETIKGIAGRIEGLFDRIDRLLVHAEGMIAQLAAFGVHGQATVDTFMVFSHNADSLVAALVGVADDVDTLIDGFGQLPAGMEAVLGTLQRDLDEAEVLLKGLQNHWLFRRSVRKTRTAQKR